MCGRFASALKPSDAWLELMQEWSDELFNRYNVSPTSQIGAFVEGQCHAMRWGLVPSWSKEISNRYATFNARIESIESKPAFRNAWRRNQKCLIPALGYYEWQKESDGKQPYFVTSKEQGPLIFAGLWDECQFDDASLKSCTIITTESEQHLKDLHSRMPVMLDVDGAKQWLSSADGKDVLLSQCRADVEIYKVDRRVNNAREEDEGLITCVD
jgi:putative SOS response-associated peptidase YedK